jgi:hypothetical protein
MWGQSVRKIRAFPAARFAARPLENTNLGIRKFFLEDEGSVATGASRFVSGRVGSVDRAILVAGYDASAPAARRPGSVRGANKH